MIPQGAKILAASDLGEAGDVAIQAADAVCRRHAGKLTVIHVAREREDEAPSEDARLRTELDNQVQSRTTGPYETILVEGRAAEQLLAAADEIGADLVVLGGRDAGETRWVLGSVAESVVTRAKMPVLVARNYKGSGGIVAATDFSEPSLPAVRAGHALSRALGQKVTLVHCMPKGTSDADVAAARARLHEICELSPEDDEARVVLGPPAESLVSVADEVDASIIVVASSGKSGLQRFRLGSVAESVVRSARCSVLVVRLRD